MSEWGEQSDDSPMERREPGHAFGIDIAAFTADLVKSSFRKALQKEVATAVSQVVESIVTEALDEDMLLDLRLQAHAAASDAVALELSVLTDEPEPEEEAPALYYGSVDEFVREYLVNAYRRRVDGHTRIWAAEWWNYDEAVIRLDALWRSWESLRLDPSTGMSVWWRDHADHHMSVLFSNDGPFAGIAEDPVNKNKKGEPLPYAAPPEDLFPDQREVTE